MKTKTEERTHDKPDQRVCWQTIRVTPDLDRWITHSHQTIDKMSFNLKTWYFQLVAQQIPPIHTDMIYICASAILWFTLSICLAWTLVLPSVHHYRSYWSFYTIASAISFISDTPSWQIWNFLLLQLDQPQWWSHAYVRHAAEREPRAGPSLAKITRRRHAAFKFQCLLVSWRSSAVGWRRHFVACGQYRRRTGTTGQVGLLCPRNANRHCCKHQRQD